jgi:hypothetical protein
MSDIFLVQPWSEEDRWHKRSFWIYDDGTYSVDSFSDGDHEDCDEEDLPSWDELDTDWREYHQFVASTGEDPLNEFMVRRERSVQQVWFASFAQYLGGVCVTRLQHAGRRYSRFHEIPQPVCDYLMLEQTGNPSLLRMDITWTELTKALGRDPGRALHRMEIARRIPRPAPVVVRELKAAARKALAYKSKLLSSV